MASIDWQALANISELKPYFDADFEGFKQRILVQMESLQAIAPEELDKLALLRVLEVTNGCLQWAFRRQDEQALSVEQTRACMQVVIGFIKEKKIVYPNKKSLTFSPEVMELIETGTLLYRQAFKQNLETAKADYFVYSTAQFIVYGRQRIEWAEAEVKTHFTDLFSDYFVGRGQNYIKPYCEALKEI
ncbi:MAG: hypothetical protein VKJ27_06860 [Synechocystis sp.]|nr:hypothetical protein [Synechocystis sp.]